MSQSRLSIKAQYKNLLSREAEIDNEIKIWKEKLMPSYEMELLHTYNDIKDATQLLLGTVANAEGVTTRELHKKFQLPIED